MSLVQAYFRVSWVLLLTVDDVGGNDNEENVFVRFLAASNYHAALCGDPYLSIFLFLPCRVEDEAVLDRGASFVKHVCDEEEVEGELSNKY